LACNWLHQAGVVVLVVHSRAIRSTGHLFGQVWGSFNGLIGAAEQRQRHGQSKRLNGVEIDDQFEFYDLLDR
jgi:hypothetical protein